MGKMRIFALIGIICCQFHLYNSVQAQQYHALHGSPYAGALSILNNPASSVNNLHKWDLNLFSFQTTVSTNHLLLENFSYRNPGNTTLKVEEGVNNYFVHQSTDFNLMHFQYQIDRKSAFTVGFRGRMYDHYKSTSPFAFSDTLSSTYSFLNINRTTPSMGGFATHAGFLEMNLNYAREIYSSPYSRLTGGITLQIDKAISGAYTKMKNVTTQEVINGTDTNYVFIDGIFEYAYSDNYDLKYTGGADFAKAFVKNSKTGIGLSLGLEYTTYRDPVEEGSMYNPLNYDWKFGFSIMDLGTNKYKPSTTSGIYADPIAQYDYTVFENKFGNVTSATEFKDSLKTVFNGYDSIYNDFSIIKPTRIILNIDKNLGNHFAVNAQLNMNLSSTSNYTQLNTRETNLITVTPRWENIAWGFYLPIQYNSQGQLWIGAAVKLGPLTMGFHDFSGGKTIKSINGGGYLSLSIHPFNKKKVLTRLDCPD
ncbi:MAG: hypothetical protein B7Y76_01600 [Sphingobacteriia bacterium 35-40-5]|nr:MAG: hypothetical protein B7Y76_01600 [Sphingobacteriia bacterium 35-40-5]